MVSTLDTAQLLKDMDRALGLYQQQLQKVTFTPAERSDQINMVKEIILAQFCMACYQNLRGAVMLYRHGDSYTPYSLCRNIVEHFITWRYIEKNPKQRVPQFVSSPLRKQRLFVDILFQDEKTRTVIGARRLRNRNKTLEKDIAKSYVQYGVWEKSLEIQSREADEVVAYTMPYRFFSDRVHPTALVSDGFLTDMASETIMISEFQEPRDYIIRALLNAALYTNRLALTLTRTHSLENLDDLEELDNLLIRKIEQMGEPD